MKKHHLATLLWQLCVAIALLWLAPSYSGGQTQVDVRTQTKNVDFSGAASTIPAKSGSSLPTSCKLGEMFFNTNNAPGQNLYLCAPANTWTVLVSGSSSTAGTVLSASTGQFAYYSANGTTVNGHTLAAGDIPALNYQAPLLFTGTGTKTASSTGSVTSNNCAKWDANGNIIDAGAPCGTGAGSAAFSTLTSGANTSAALVIGSGASLAASGTGTIAATSVPASGVTGLAASATTDTTNASNIASGTLAAARLPATAVTTGIASGTGAKYASATVAGTSNNCAKWDANGNVADAGAPCGTGSGSATFSTLTGGSNTSAALVIGSGASLSASGAGTIAATTAPLLNASTYVAEGDSITYGYLTSEAYPYYIQTDSRATLIDRGTSGYFACDLAELETMPNDLTTLDGNSIYSVMIGANDANSHTTTDGYSVTFNACHQAALAWIAVANKWAANGVNCTDTPSSGAWSPWTGLNTPTLIGEFTNTLNATKSCSVTTTGGPIYAWYWMQSPNTGAGTYAVDGGTAVAFTTAPAVAISSLSSSNHYGWALIRVPVAAGTHTIVFKNTTSGTGIVIAAIGTTSAQPTYQQPHVFVSGVPRQQGNANSAATAYFDSLVQANVALLAGDGLDVTYVPIRNYLCTGLASGSCVNNQGVLDMNTLTADSAGLHPNNQGQVDLKQAFEQAMQFAPYVKPYSGSGPSTVTTAAVGASGNCAKWDANGNIIDAGAACGSGGSGMVYPGAGVPNSTGSAWGTSYTAGTAANNLLQLNGSGALPAVSGVNLTALPAAAVQTNQSNTYSAGTQDLSGAAHTLPAKKGLSSAIPATCTVGELYFATDATAGQNLFECAALNTWAQQLNSGSGGSGSGTVNSGTTGQFAYYSSGGTTVGGHTLADNDLPSDQCTLTKYTVSYSSLTSQATANPTYSLLSLAGVSTRICLVEISGTTSFAGTSITAATVQVQSAAGMVYSPNQDVFGTVGPATNNYWSDAGSMADRTSAGVVAYFTLTGGNGTALTAGSVNITIGTRTMP